MKNVRVKRKPIRVGPLPIYDSMQQCVAATGIPKSELRKAKANGCPAFIASRVDLGDFVRWHFDPSRASPDASNAEQPTLDLGDADLAQPVNGTWQESKARVATLREIQKLAQDKRELLARSDVQHALSRGMADLFGELDRVFASQLPGRAKGMSEVQIRDIAEEAIEKLKDSLREKWTIEQIATAP